MSDKIRAQHLARNAVLYLRQPPAYQVSHTLESQKLQYAKQDRLQQLGWNEIRVIDEDLNEERPAGISGASRQLTSKQ
jgi:hypothetical protein